MILTMILEFLKIYLHISHNYSLMYFQPATFTHMKSLNFFCLVLFNGRDPYQACTRTIIWLTNASYFYYFVLLIFDGEVLVDTIDIASLLVLEKTSVLVYLLIWFIGEEETVSVALETVRFNCRLFL